MLFFVNYQCIISRAVCTYGRVWTINYLMFASNNPRDKKACGFGGDQRLQKPNLLMCFGHIISFSTKESVHKIYV